LAIRAVLSLFGMTAILNDHHCIAREWRFDSLTIAHDTLGERESISCQHSGSDRSRHRDTAELGCAIQSLRPRRNEPLTIGASVLREVRACAE
jgi:hypothetical protein